MVSATHGGGRHLDDQRLRMAEQKALDKRLAVVVRANSSMSTCITRFGKLNCKDFR
jgi:hypothetical protein